MHILSVDTESAGGLLYAVTTGKRRPVILFVSVWLGLVGVYDSSIPLYGVCAGCGFGTLLDILWQMQMRGGMAMRVVVIKSPKVVGGILRRLFGIQKTNQIT